MKWPLIICLAATFYLVGLIWIIQVVQYPGFAKVGQNDFIQFHADHSNSIVLALSIPTLAQFIGAFWLLGTKPAGVPDWSVWVNLALTFSFWVVTALVQVPIHGKLSGGYDIEQINLLVATNWIRTALWTAQGGLLVWMAAVGL